MGIADLLILLVVAVLFVVIARKTFRQLKSGGCAGCGGSCDGCCAHCHAHQKE